MDNMNYEDIIQYLADELSFNYLTVSFGEIQKDGYRIAGIDNEKEIMKTVFSPPFFEKVLSENGRGTDRCRNILVIGSGATSDSYGDIPLGKDTKNKLIEYLGLKNLLASNENLNKKFLEEAERLYTLRTGTMPTIDTPIYEEHTFDFENFLLLLTKFFPEKKIREEIQRLFNIRYAPCLTYEIIAHLFKHGFFDIIVNFNFDELLDQAIEEEMGLGNYHSIISDGQCKDLDEIMVDGRLKIPVYVKPHGTASHKSTLRFTKEHYFDLPQDIYDLLRELFSGKVNSSKEKMHESNFDDYLTRVNILSVGFNLDSIEFNHILEKHLPKNSRLFAAVYKNLPKIFSNENMAEKCITGGNKNIIDFSSFEEKDRIKAELPFSAKLFGELFERIQNNFSGIYKPRGIMRHELVHELFYNPAKRDQTKGDDFENAHKALMKSYNNSSFFKEKVIFEFAIALARGREIIEIKELMNDRLGLSYELYRKYFEKENPNGTPASLFEIANIFKLKEYFSFSRNVHNLTRIEEKEIKNHSKLATALGIQLSNKPIQASFAETVLFRLLSSPKTPESFKLRLKKSNQIWDELKINKIKDILTDINKKGNYLDINPRFYDRRLFIFDHYYKDQILHTNLSLTYRENEVIESPKYWDYCFAVSDTGKFLDKELDWVTDKANHIYLIACMEAVKGADDCTKFYNIEELRKKHHQKFEFIKDRLTVRLLPYNDHSHHMLIFLKKATNIGEDKLSKFPTIQVYRSKQQSKEDFICVRSIYYYTRGFTKKINPMWIKGAFAFLKNEDTVFPRNFRPKLLAEDHKMLLETFYAYHIKAETYEKTNGEMYEILFPKDIKPKNNHTSRKFNVESLFDFIEKEIEASRLQDSL